MEEKSVGTTSQSAIGRALDYLQVALLVALVLTVIGLLASFYWVWWSFILTKPPTVARIWAIVATTLLPFVAAGGFWFGTQFGAHRARWMVDGIREVSKSLAPLFAQFGTEAADVRMYAGRGLYGLWRESKKSQELQLPPPIEIVEHEERGNSGGVVEV